ncbi:hypothetical protein MAPG_09246 [Magnaporthiopsis poae ATCC 64411]|uniref:Uncharacterized protein n=1 Tax=Magnaporthiopsis poae (strain ATCC 64411 / 73-15) TaxID=644358 RepID=A0A0C4E9G1_MAGP6|nr:hypothetical protein MAPG_09246 [Magnaporthiopsis poae ATCC 64411]
MNGRLVQSEIRQKPKGKKKAKRRVDKKPFVASPDDAQTKDRDGVIVARVHSLQTLGLTPLGVIRLDTRAAVAPSSHGSSNEGGLGRFVIVGPSKPCPPTEITTAPPCSSRHQGGGRQNLNG